MKADQQGLDRMRSLGITRGSRVWVDGTTATVVRFMQWVAIVHFDQERMNTPVWYSRIEGLVEEECTR